ncbi:serine/threonine-protein kinase [Caballeronia sp. DA-9]|uniref:serine/threonine-protein kinase n=1 Tax=Caballeronia sp. DA-9 TaxID=3436237 RepID=UPI003F675717
MIDSGKLIGERYTVAEHVGSGGMQDVYRARDGLLNIDVALKTPQVGQAVKRFANSAVIAARVNHHNVAKTLDYFVDDVAYLVEEFVEGESLEQKLTHFGVLDPHLGARLLHHLAKGVAASHRAGVIHRDLKPSNIMASAGVNLQNLKITDFGIATLTEEVFDEAAKAGDLTRSTSGTVRGALPFMAPEMMFRKPGESPGPEIDIWSVGAMMFRLLTGEYPFGVYLDAAVNVKNRDRKPWPAFMTSNIQFAPLARELQAIVDQCLSYEASDRPTADNIVSQCQNLCYLAVNREVGRVEKFIQNGSSGFIDGDSDTVFFSIESVYGTSRPNLGDNQVVCYSSFPGAPRRRAHPILVLKA